MLILQLGKMQKKKNVIKNVKKLEEFLVDKIIINLILAVRNPVLNKLRNMESRERLSNVQD